MKKLKITEVKKNGVTRIIVETAQEVEDRVKKRMNQELCLKVILLFAVVIILTVIIIR